MFHLLFQCGSELEYQQENLESGLIYERNINPVPIQLILYHAFFPVALLWIAHGYAIEETTSHFLCGYWWANQNHWPNVIQKYIVREFNAKKEALQKAYHYYCAYENGFVGSATDVDVNCLLWIVCALGNIEILNSISQANLNVNEKVKDVDFTPLMMAVSCGHENVVDWLIQKGADIHASFVTKDPHPFSNGDSRKYTDHKLSFNEESHLLFLAVEYKEFAIVEKLIRAGLKPTVAQQTAITEGLKTLTSQPSALGIGEPVNNSHALQLISKTKQILENTKITLESMRLQIASKPKNDSGEITDSDDDDILRAQTQEFFAANAVPQWEKTDKPGQRVLCDLAPKDRFGLFNELKKARGEKDVFQQRVADKTELVCQLAVVSIR